MRSDRAEEAITPTSVHAQLARIVSSELFTDSPRMVRFLQFAVQETLNGKAQQLKENVIGVQVFDRPSDYDPRIDPIVRVEARRLRLKLRGYYEGPGKADELVVELPKGRYSPAFQIRSEVIKQRSDQASTIAVLPFTNLNPGAEADFLSDGLTEDLISALTRISDLRVSAWASAARMRGEQDNLDTIREVLGATHVLRGSIRNTQERIRVSAYLIETASKRYIWSETFDRGLKDVFAIQDEITRAIASALQAKLNPGSGNLRKGGSTSDLECYQLCLKGRFHARERSAAGLHRSVLCFEEAARVDPRSANAYAGLADAYALQAEYGYEHGPTSMQKAKAAVQQALILDPNAAETQASYGLILALYDWSWDEAEAAFRRSLDLNPNYAAAHHWYGMNLLAVLGRLDEAAVEMDMAVTLDPLTPIVKEGTGYLRFLRREYVAAVSIYKEVLADDPSYYKAYSSMGRAYLHEGKLHEAIEMLIKARSMAGHLPTLLGALGQAYGLVGDRAAALGILDTLKEISANRAVPSTCFSLVHLGLGNKDAALDWLERGIQGREATVVVVPVHPAFDGLRSETRFQSLMERIVPPAAATYRKMQR